MYDKSNTGVHLRKYVHVSLALWHNYKWATAKLFKVFGRDFIGPFFHRLFPDTAIDLTNFNHSSATTILSYMRLSFPHFKDELEQTMTLPSLTGRAKIDLTNLWHLLNYFIPVVQCKYDSVTSCFLVHTFVHPFK